MNSHRKSARWLIALASTVSCVLLSAATTRSQCINPPANLVLWYPLDETTAAFGTRDFVSGTYSTLVPNAAGSITNVAFVPGQQSGAFFFDTTNLHPPTPGAVGYFLAPNSSTTDFGTGSASKDFSIDFWVYDMGCFDPLRTSSPSVLVPCRQYWMGTGAQGTGWAVSTAWPQGQLVLELSQPTGSPLLVAQASFALNTWVHIAITVNRLGPITTYINGAQNVPPQNVDTRSIDLTSGRQLVIGGTYWAATMTGPVTPQAWARGYLDELEIYDRELTSAEIQQIYANGKCKPKGMTWYRQSTNATNGTISVGCGGGTNACNPYVGDRPCTDSLPLLCFKPSGFPIPHSVTSTQYNLWSGGIVGTTPPVVPYPSLSKIQDADQKCVDEFGIGWRTAEFHDGWGWNFQAYGNVGTLANRFWVHINDQHNATCWTF